MVSNDDFFDRLRGMQKEGFVISSIKSGEGKNIPEVQILRELIVALVHIDDIAFMKEVNRLATSKTPNLFLKGFDDAGGGCHAVVDNDALNKMINS